MSQFYVGVSEGSLPVDVPTSFTTDLGTAVPDNHILDVKGVETANDNIQGIQTRGGTSTQGGATNDLEIQFTNRATGTIQTTDNSTLDVITLDLSTVKNSSNAALGNGLLGIEIEIVAYVDALPTGAHYTLNGDILFFGGNILILGTPVRTMTGDATIFDVSQVAVSFSGSNIEVEVTGITGTTIKWTAYLSYLFGGA